ncbi:MAG: hypothetical protein OEY01_13600 [Desulfobulbaceae bacterium]|nr:hypothetical protein [Desulfobulbaceae bacterium]
MDAHWLSAGKKLEIFSLIWPVFCSSKFIQEKYYLRLSSLVEAYQPLFAAEAAPTVLFPIQLKLGGNNLKLLFFMQLCPVM